MMGELGSYYIGDGSGDGLGDGVLLIGEKVDAYERVKIPKSFGLASSVRSSFCWMLRSQDQLALEVDLNNSCAYNLPKETQELEYPNIKINIKQIKSRLVIYIIITILSYNDTKSSPATAPKTWLELF